MSKFLIMLGAEVLQCERKSSSYRALSISLVGVSRLQRLGVRLEVAVLVIEVKLKIRQLDYGTAM